MATGEAEGALRGDRFPQAGPVALVETLAAQVQQGRADETDGHETGLAPAFAPGEQADDQHVGRDQEPLVAQFGEQHEELVQAR
ncbi:hypothetical protein D3C71_1723390 [compost metagenome]